MVPLMKIINNNGIYNWLIQRITAVLLLVYTMFIVLYLLNNPNLNYENWSELHAGIAMKVFSLITLISLGAHAWIGLWTVSTDYIKSTGYRCLFQTITTSAILLYLAWGMQLIWSQ